MYNKFLRLITLFTVTNSRDDVNILYVFYYVTISKSKTICQQLFLEPILGKG